MQKAMKRNILYLLIPVLVSMFSACQKESENVPGSLKMQSPVSIIGTWVEENSADTLYVVNDHIFNRSLREGIRHTFEYSLKEDSIVIQYKGPDKIFVLPRTHFYSLDGNRLVIIYSNPGYGIDEEKETFIKCELK
jgi:hypothetical protein